MPAILFNVGLVSQSEPRQPPDIYFSLLRKKSEIKVRLRIAGLIIFLQAYVPKIMADT